jgi:hypothetical protein
MESYGCHNPCNSRLKQSIDQENEIGDLSFPSLRWPAASSRHPTVMAGEPCGKNYRRSQIVIATAQLQPAAGAAGQAESR